MAIIKLRADGSEDVLYDYESYPAYIRHGLLSRYPNYTAESHWHEDLEFIYVLSGNMYYHVNGEIVLLRKGTGIFVNAEQIHFGFSPKREECSFLCILLHPSLISSTESIERKFLLPILSNIALPYLFLTDTIPWQKDILKEIERIYAEHNSPTALLRIQRAFLQIWILLYEHLPQQSPESISPINRLSTLKNMLFFIQQNYTEKLSLEDIASAGYVSKSTCLSLFRRYIQDTPIHYLSSYRLHKAAHLLTHSTMSVTEIALAVGFQGNSYFGECFRLAYGYSPREFRNRKTKG